jgi:hypothetical protein
MKLLKKILKAFTKPSKKPEGECDRCSITIWEGDRALCFHGTGEDLFLCEPCVEYLREKFIEDDEN